MRMLAAVMYEQGLPKPYAATHPFRIEEVELEPPGAGEVLVEVRAAGLCHSDLAQVEGLRKRKLPVVGGHEAAGVIVETGHGVEGLKAGDHVVMSVVAGCGSCPTCSRHRPALCDTVTAPRTQGLLATGARRLSRQGAPIYHYSGISGFAQYSVAVPGSLITIDRDIPLEDAALYGCAVITGAGAVFNTARVKPGDAVAVIGLGGVGLNGIMAAKIAGASVIIGIDLNPGKFALASELGATHVIAASEPELKAQVLDLTRGGVDFAFEMSGARAAVGTAYAITRKGGEIICVGLGATDALYEYKHAALVSEEKALRGCFMGSSLPSVDIPKYLSYYRDGRMPVNKLRSGEIGFEDLNLSLDLLDRGDVVRQVLIPNR